MERAFRTGRASTVLLSLVIASFVVAAFAAPVFAQTEGGRRIRSSNAAISSAVPAPGEINRRGRSEFRLREELANYFSPGFPAGAAPYDCGCPDQSLCACDTGCGQDDCLSCGSCGRYYAGFETTFLKPRFSDNVAFTVMHADGASFESFFNEQFNYDYDVSPRMFVGRDYDEGIGVRATWWQFDHGSSVAMASPPANGFGRITHPMFGSVDISSVIPSDIFSATSDVYAQAIDLEVTKVTQFCSWDFGFGYGIRYARVEQAYRAQLRDGNGILRGSIDYEHNLSGIGPTMSLDAYRALNPCSGIFCQGRASLLYGDGKSRLSAVEDADLTTPFFTSAVTSRHDLLPIGQLQVGYRWQGAPSCRRPFIPFASLALEGQVWHGAGQSASEDGTLGFFGLSASAGAIW